MRPDPEAIFGYEDHRQFLADTYSAAKARSPMVSHRWIALRAGFASSGFFSRILAGRVNMGPATVSGLVKLMELRGREADYFAAMVEFNQSPDPAKREQAANAMVRLRSGGGNQLTASQVEFWSHCRYALVRDALWVEPFDGDADAWGARFLPPMAGEDVRKAIDLLLQLELAEIDETGMVRRSDVRSLTSGLKSSEEAIADYQLSCLDLARQALEDAPPLDRNFSTLSFSIPLAKWPEFEAEIRRFRRTMLAMAEESTREDRLMHMNLHVFPVFRKV